MQISQESVNQEREKYRKNIYFFEHCSLRRCLGCPQVERAEREVQSRTCTLATMFVSLQKAEFLDSSAHWGALLSLDKVAYS